MKLLTKLYCHWLLTAINGVQAGQAVQLHQACKLLTWMWH